MRKYGRSFITIACVLFTVAAAYNVMADEPEVKELAERVACGEQGAACNAQMSSLERTPFARTFGFVTPKRTVTVRCMRALVMVGAYACELH
jgi:hypothetical protein